MSLCQITRWKMASGAVVLAVVLLAIPAVLNAQQQDNPPKAEVFIGYQWLNPGAKLPVGRDSFGNALPYKLPAANQGLGGSFAYNFTKYLALEGDLGSNWNDPIAESTISVGPKLTFRTEGLNMFLHTLVGLNHIDPKVTNLPSKNGIGSVLGGGIDLPLTKSLSWRMIEADYVWAHHNFSEVTDQTDPLRHVGFDGVRLRTGVVFNIGGTPEVPPAAVCSIDRSEVLVGEPLHVTVAPSNFNPKHTLTYNWSSTGGKIDGKDTGAAIDTNGAAPGSYTATARVSDPKKSKNGEASCTSNFTVKPLNPPQISCSASPTTVEVGTSSSVSCTCTSPDNVPVTVSGWTSSSGSISGSGNAATLTTTGAQAGTATINATCTDSRGLTASATSAVTVNNPPPPPPPVVDKVLEARLALHSVYFPTAKPPVKDPMAGLVASQQATLTALATDFQKYREAKPDAHLTLTGHADVRGSKAYNQALSERRVARVKSFLVERGVPEANIETQALGDQHNLTAAEVKASLEQNTELTKGERTRVLRNMKTIIWASNRRVDITLNAAGQATETSVRQYPFNATDSLTLIGGREVPKKAPAAKAPTAKKTTKKPAAKK